MRPPRQAAEAVRISMTRTSNQDGKVRAEGRGRAGAEAAVAQASSPRPPWVEGLVRTPAGDVPRVGTALVFADRLGSFKVRLGIRRTHYSVAPGLYAVGRPTPESPVLVTANYKMSFDRLRSQLSGIDAWVLVLDTKGINVWCAAGKGTFGTDEIVSRVQAVRLGEIVSHRRLILPQLSAPGVSAHRVRSGSGFRVVYGPVRAGDLPAFLSAGMKATPEMRRVRFDLRDRLVLTPMEIAGWAKYLLLAAAGLLVLAGVGADGYSWQRAAAAGSRNALVLAAGYLAGTVIAPALLPWLPGRAFSAKGAWLGLGLDLGLLAWWLHSPGLFASYLGGAAWLLMLPAVASFLAMNFTGASTYTSLSGVRREVRIALPIQAVSAGVGLALWLAGRFV